MNGRASVSIWAIFLIICFCCLNSGCPSTAAIAPVEESVHPPHTPPEEPVDSPPPEEPALPASTPEPPPPTPQVEPSPPVPQQSAVGTPQGPRPPVSTASPSGAQTASLKKAKRLFDSAKSKRRSGDYSGAFLEAREAWNLIQDSEIQSGQELSVEIREELDFLAGRLTPSKRNPPSKFKTLILK